MSPTTLNEPHTIPLVAILRGVKSDEVLSIVKVLIETGIRIVEIPLNSPNPFDSLQAVANRFDGQLLLGAGTVLSGAAVEDVASAGGKLIISPNTDIGVIQRTKELGLVSVPGSATPSEIFTAIDAGADAIKAFPAELITPEVIRSWRSIVPKTTPIFPVGGINMSNMSPYWQSGASGFGIGGNLYRPGKNLAAIREDAYAIVEEIKRLNTL